jgi:cardiolipin synthase
VERLFDIPDAISGGGNVSGWEMMIRSLSLFDESLWMVLAVILAGFGLISAGHALLYKRDPRSSLGWIWVCVSFPLVGPLFYWSMGVNWIRRKAQQWQERGRFLSDGENFPLPVAPVVPCLQGNETALGELCSLTDRVVGADLVAGNRISPLINGEAAYAEMVAAIEAARESIHLSTYIFDGDDTGGRFVAALRRAVGRGVAVRVIIDALGEKYSRPTARSLLKGSGVEIGRFLPLRQGIYINLRNHRKILVVDGRTGFTGGMNIGDRHLVDRQVGPPPVRDMHFKVEGPVVRGLQQLFLEDWYFVTGEIRRERSLFPNLPAVGSALARVIADGPDKEYRKLHCIIMGALACARRRVNIVTPYFIPDRAMISALVTTALRGVNVTLLLPSSNNLPVVHWACRSYLWELLQHGIRVLYQPPPFVHTKLFQVDGVWSLIGTANLDPRSLRLNFEVNMEIYDEEFGGRLEGEFDRAVAQSREVSLAEMDSRPLPERVRDGLAKLFSPYL